MGQMHDRLRAILDAEPSISDDAKHNISLVIWEVAMAAFREGYEEGAYVEFAVAAPNDPHHERVKDVWDTSTIKASLWSA